jgi:D-isomer specific 2-hydroxyacid dehydrogenase, NAD binding domain
LIAVGTLRFFRSIIAIDSSFQFRAPAAREHAAPTSISAPSAGLAQRCYAALLACDPCSICLALFWVGSFCGLPGATSIRRGFSPSGTSRHRDPVLVFARLLDVVGRPVGHRLDVGRLVEHVEQPVEADRRAVQRGRTIDEKALYEALLSKRIAGAVIDTWYRYPESGRTDGYPSTLPFHELPNVVMTPHMSGWTLGTIRRRQKAIAENIKRLVRGEPCANVVRPRQG